MSFGTRRAPCKYPLSSARAQRQMVLEGKMHGFLRMYWAKKAGGRRS